MRLLPSHLRLLPGHLRLLLSRFRHLPGHLRPLPSRLRHLPGHLRLLLCSIALLASFDFAKETVSPSPSASLRVNLVEDSPLNGGNVYFYTRTNQDETVG